MHFSDIRVALQVLKSDLQPTEDHADRRAENLFVPISYFLNKPTLSVRGYHILHQYHFDDSTSFVDRHLNKKVFSLF